MFFMSEEWFICGVMLKNTWARTMKHFNGAKGRLNCLHPSATPSQHGDLVMPHPRAGAPCHWHAQISQQSKPIACAGSAGRLTVLQTGVEQQALIRFSDASARKASAKGHSINAARLIAQICTGAATATLMCVPTHALVNLVVQTAHSL